MQPETPTPESPNSQPISPPSEPSPVPQVSLETRVLEVLQTFGECQEAEKICKAVLKLYPKGTKKNPLDQPTPGEIQAILDGTQVFRWPPKKVDGPPRYWHQAPPTPSEIVARSVLPAVEALGNEPVPLKAISKLATNTNPEIAQAFQALIQRLLAEGKLFVHPGDLYGKVAPPTPAEVVAREVMTKLDALGANELISEKKLAKLSIKGEEYQHAFRQLLQQLLNEKKLFAHPKNQYGKTAPPSPQEIVAREVQAKLDALGANDLISEKELAKLSVKGEQYKSAFQEVLQTLINEKKLFVHAKKQYGKTAPLPPKWYELPAAKGEAVKIEKASRKLLDSGLRLDDLILFLQERLGTHKTTATPVEPTAPVTTPAQPQTTPVSPPVTLDLRSALKKAYDHLCLFVEFRDKLVELRRLYHETRKLVPSLTIEQFHDELTQMNKEWIVDLQFINEVHMAEEKELAIYRNDRLYYYARWM